MVLKLHRIAATLVAIALLPVPIAGAADEMQTLTLRSGHSVVLQTPGLSRVAVGDGRIAGVIPIANAEVIVNGKTAGRTTMFIWRGARRTTYEVSVSEQPLDDIASMLRSSITNPGVQVASFDRSVVVSGAVQTPEEFGRVSDVVSRFDASTKGGKYNLVNAVTVSRPMGTLQRDISAAAGGSDVKVDRDAKGNIVVSGRVLDRMTAERFLDRVRTSGGGYLGADAKVIDRLGVELTSQIDVKVYILEVDQTALDQLGVRLQAGTPIQGQPGFYTLGDPLFPVLENPNSNFSGQPNSGPANLGRALNIGAFSRTTILAPTLDLVMRNGHARLLSSPDLVTMPGRQATFLVGGEIPIPYASGPQQIAIVYKEFGVRLDVTPTILGSGEIETRIAPEVSDLDFADAVAINGFFVPALKTSKLSTDVVTRPGESIIMGGLLRRQQTRNIDKIPLLGDIPILGKLFRSTRYQNLETDVVFVMTPQVITR
ncbi:MAG: type and secretion system protein [Candidatus Eremiobacteraeota bacterium]|nr:type and secretion system protein [Candidatus Eremiobacteraeota bacterium]